jgi:hypothetical protein
MPEYFNREGEPISHETWRELFEDFEYRSVAQWRGENGATVSTVWLGLAHGFGPTGAMIFESLYSCPGEEDEVYRYGTEEEARASHQRLVELAQTNAQYIPGHGVIVDDDTPEDRWKGIIEEHAGKPKTTS